MLPNVRVERAARSTVGEPRRDNGRRACDALAQRCYGLIQRAVRPQSH
jgi:hypothetical protein